MIRDILITTLFLQSVVMNQARHSESSKLIKYYVLNQPPVELSTLDSLPAKTEGDLLWISLSNPTDEELTHLLPRFVKQERVIEEMQTKHLRPKVVEYEKASLIVAITVHLNKGAVGFGESQILFGEGFVVSVWRNTSLSDLQVQQYLEETPEQIERGADYVVAEILDFITDDYTDSLLQFEKQVLKAEKHFFVGHSEKKDIEQVYRLRHTLLRIQSSIAPLAELSRRFMRQNLSYIGEDSRAYFYEVADRIDRQADLIRSLRDTLAFAFEAGMMIGQLQQNDITRKLAAWAAILAIPTAVAGIYGMNFINMPELNLRYGYPAVLGAMGVVCGSLYRQFKKIGWL